ncbi:uncharacterized protein LOC111592666 [Drosophila hydei]|uniref:Uncharacterized protein LOC111592666 n=1 Tax=Drosophila hydei TaxID=7224 RepID=A0A6J1LBZ2_DROHY|nr:uncharacterized protein LOC111592666 [Drosophila hydei]XP_023160794.1 uncharacterized protein LOC111592666 [Drosophila hydei]XP_023160795.1 uncharacterized protein LOC111592666 [Drosophila hydei]
MAAPSVSLLTLDDYCLANVFRYFTLDELMVNLGKVHPRIDNAIERQLHRYRHIEFSMRFPPQYDKNQFQILGQYVEVVNINVGYSIRPENVLSILQPLCVGAKESGKLKALKIQHANITTDYINVIHLVAPLLLELDLSRCDVEDLTQLNMILTSATKLKTLALNNKDVEGLDTSLFSRLHVFKINWLMGTNLLNVTAINQQFPFLTIAIYKSNQVDIYGPPLIKNTGYFH